jgi:hypothetical protein
MRKPKAGRRSSRAEVRWRAGLIAPAAARTHV